MKPYQPQWAQYILLLVLRHQASHLGKRSRDLTAYSLALTVYSSEDVQQRTICRANVKPAAFATEAVLDLPHVSCNTMMAYPTGDVSWLKPLYHGCADLTALTTVNDFLSQPCMVAFLFG